MDLLINYAATNFIVNCSWMRIKTVGRYKIACTVSLSQCANYIRAHRIIPILNVHPNPVTFF
jgi:hypothetical protein